MRRRILLWVILCILCLLLFYLNHKKEIVTEASPNLETTQIEPVSSITNTTTKMKSNNNKFDQLESIVNKIRFKSNIATLLDESNASINDDIEVITEQIATNKSVLNTDSAIYDNIKNNLEAINEKLNTILYSYDITMQDDNPPFKQLEIVDIENNSLVCEDEDTTYIIDLENVKNQESYANGDMIKAYYSTLVFEDNVGKIFVYFIEKI